MPISIASTKSKHRGNEQRLRPIYHDILPISELIYSIFILNNSSPDTLFVSPR